MKEAVHLDEEIVDDHQVGFVAEMDATWFR